VRHFLAVYKFYANLSLQNLLNCLRILQNNPFREQRERKFVKIKNLNSTNSDIYGYVEYGVSGYEIPVYDYNNGIHTKTIDSDECPTNYYFFRFYFINTDSGILLLERIGNVGVRKALLEAINNVCGNNSIKANPIIFGVSNLLENGQLKKIILKVKLFPKEIEAKLQRSEIRNPDDELEREIVLYAKRNKRIEGFLDWFRNQFKNLQPSKLGELLQKEFGENVEQIKLVLKVNNSQRTLVFRNGWKFRTWLEIERGSLDLTERLNERLRRSEEIIELINNENEVEMEEED